MRCIITGTGEDGRSYVAREKKLDATNELTVFWETMAGDGTTFPIGDPELRELLPPGHTKWTAVQLPPHQQRPMHWTESVDFEVVIQGRLELVLDEGSVMLEPGDCVVMTGLATLGIPEIKGVCFLPSFME